MSNKLTARQISRQKFGKSNNFMTPTVIGYGKAGKDCAWELSVGEGFNHDPLYGVTVLRFNGFTGDKNQVSKWENSYDESKSFNSLIDAREYIGKIPHQLEVVSE